jgi:DNA polymerase V
MIRRQGSDAGAVYVFVMTNRFRPDEPQNNVGRMVPFTEPTDDTRLLKKAALKGLNAVYKKGFGYKKAGVLLAALANKSTRQYDLFSESPSTVRSQKLMASLDAINKRFGTGNSGLALLGSSSTGVSRCVYYTPVSAGV